MIRELIQMAWVAATATSAVLTYLPYGWGHVVAGAILTALATVHGFAVKARLASRVQYRRYTRKVTPMPAQTPNHHPE